MSTRTRVRRMATDIKRPLLGREATDDVETGLVNGALGLLGVLEGDADLVAELGSLVAAQHGLGLRKVVF
ncbi:hypothetical protein RRF57_008552 [Xylaria bambusicola]|uniref:Uncharacterized protein n=1 Tax=Xylaria bambusicola TaxID=326684 RepID=A0AAN7V1V0_9PEZI